VPLRFGFTFAVYLPYPVGYLVYGVGYRFTDYLPILPRFRSINGLLYYFIQLACGCLGGVTSNLGGGLLVRGIANEPENFCQFAFRFSISLRGCHLLHWIGLRVALVSGLICAC
jgi:hypothetical protein